MVKWKGNNELFFILTKFISSHQRDWDGWVPMFLLAYRSSKHETTKISSLEVYFARNLRLTLDLLRGIPSEKKNNLSNRDYVLDLRK